MVIPPDPESAAEKVGSVEIDRRDVGVYEVLAGREARERRDILIPPPLELRSKWFSVPKK